MLRKWLWSVNRKILIPVLFLQVISIITILRIVTSATERFNMGAIIFIVKHVIMILLSLLMIFIFSRKKKEFAIKWGDRFFLIALILVILTFPLAKKINGVRRWISIFGFSIQASEMLKTFIIFPISYLLLFDYHKASMCVMFFCTLLCTLQPDLGMAFLTSTHCFSVFFFQGKNLLLYLYVALLGGICIFISGIFLAKYAYKRILIFFGKTQGFQINRALSSLKNSNLLGQGKYIYIPDSHCDFIFTEICNNLGIMVGMFVILVPVIIFMQVDSQIENLSRRERMIVFGLTIQIIIQSYFHVLSNLAFVPTKGVSLPMISMGGSNLITHGISIGIILSILKIDI